MLRVSNADCLVFEIIVPITEIHTDRYLIWVVNIMFSACHLLVLLIFLAHLSCSDKVSLSDCILSVIRRECVPASVNSCFKQHLLLNHLLEFNQASQKWSFGESLLKLFRWFLSVVQFGREALNGSSKCNFSKILFSITIRPKAKIFGMKHHLVDLYQDCSNVGPQGHNEPPWSFSC